MEQIDTLIVGAGQAGLAVSRCLADRGQEHLLLERGRVAESWRSARWDSLRLLTPNWMTRLPGFRYQGDDPDGFMARDEVVRYLGRYADSFAAPVREQTTVLSAAPREGGGFRIETDRGLWLARNLVVATGDCAKPHVPRLARRLPPDLLQLTPDRYRNPRQLPGGGVLVVGASATGVQLADELRRSGRQVTLAVGGHTRALRRYRGRDIMWWFDRMGLFDRSIADMPDAEAARREPSFQLVGREDRGDLDLGTLASRGVQLVGRLVRADGSRLLFAPDLAHNVADADGRLGRLLERIDAFIAANGMHAPAPDAWSPVRLPASIPTRLDLRAAGIETVLWATGYRRSFPWLHAPVFDERGDIRHQRGRTPLSGLYVLGLRFMIRRRSHFLDGVGLDAAEIADSIAGEPRPHDRLAA
ncbi:MAG TPA: NAD(P)-binding domain-containing protein [Thermoanaerobaculia bacterium]|nr:NAD(P)-binding domain-containing protein [Thermoanaerobaculia bacterium]